MIEGMADTGAALNKPKYTTAAANAADFILSSLRTKDGRLKRTFGEGHAKLNGYLDDYSFLIAGLIALHEATGEEKWLTAAKELTDKQIELFWDKKSGGFFFTSHDHEQLIARGKDPIDGAIPAGNAVAAQNMLYLAKHYVAPMDDTKTDYQEQARATIEAMLPWATRSPAHTAGTAKAAAMLLSPKK